MQAFEILDSVFSNNVCDSGTLVDVKDLHKYINFTTVTIEENTVNYADGGTVTINPKGETADLMPILNDVKFIKNTNKDD